MQFAKFSIASDQIREVYNSDAAYIGLALSLVGSVGLIFGISAGVLAERLGYRRVLVGALVFGVFLDLAQSLFPPIAVLMITRILEGVSQSLRRQP